MYCIVNKEIRKHETTERTNKGSIFSLDPFC